MSKRPCDFLIEDIWEAIERVERFTEGMTRESFGTARQRTIRALYGPVNYRAIGLSIRPPGSAR